MTDPYEILGVSKTANLEEIKSAYKKMARKFHPDLNPGNKEAENKFKEVSHAFDLIGTAEARKKFDEGETDEQKQKMYEEYMKQRRSGQRPFYHQSQRDEGRYSSSFDAGFDDDIFANIFGSARGGGGIDFPGQDAQYQLEIDFLEAARGAEKIITLPNGKKLQVKIPAGIAEGKKLKFGGFGGPGIGRGKTGDAFVEIRIRPSEDFRREGLDIYSEVPVNLFEAINGAEVEVKTIDGPVNLKIPPGVTTGSKLRIKGKGAGSGSAQGNHIVTIKVVTPKDPTPEMKEAFRHLEERFTYNPRTQV